jgi:hypothetical protein
VLFGKKRIAAQATKIAVLHRLKKRTVIKVKLIVKAKIVFLN